MIFERKVDVFGAEGWKLVDGCVRVDFFGENEGLCLWLSFGFGVGFVLVIRALARFCGFVCDVVILGWILRSLM